MTPLETPIIVSAIREVVLDAGAQGLALQGFFGGGASALTLKASRQHCHRIQTIRNTAGSDRTGSSSNPLV